MRIFIGLASLLFGSFFADPCCAADSPPGWVVAPYLKGGHAATFCMESGDRRLEFAIAEAMNSIAEEIEGIARDTLETLRSNEEPDSDESEPSESEVHESLTSQALGRNVFVETKVRSVQKMKEGRFESSYESLMRVTFYNGDKSQKRVLKRHASFSEQGETKNYEQQHEVEEDGLDWQVVATSLLEDTHFHLHNDNIEFPDGTTRLCAFVGYAPN